MRQFAVAKSTGPPAIFLQIWDHDLFVDPAEIPVVDCVEFYMPTKACRYLEDHMGKGAMVSIDYDPTFRYQPMKLIGTLAHVRRSWEEVLVSLAHCEVIEQPHYSGASPKSWIIRQWLAERAGE